MWFFQSGSERITTAGTVPSAIIFSWAGKGNGQRLPEPEHSQRRLRIIKIPHQTSRNQYLQKFGFETTTGTFAANSWYFRNALVRANFDDVKTGVRGTTQFLDLFFDNLVLGKNHDLKNRHLHIDWKA